MKVQVGCMTVDDSPVQSRQQEPSSDVESGEEDPLIPTTTKHLEDSEEQVHDDKICNSGAITGILKSHLGIGILALPYAIKNAGMTAGPIMLSVLILTYWYSIKRATWSAKAAGDQLKVDPLSYVDLVKCTSTQETVGSVTRFMKWLISWQNFAACAVYVSFILTHAKELIHPKITTLYPSAGIMVALVSIFFLLFFLRRMSFMVLFATLGSVFYLFVVISVLAHAGINIKSPSSLPPTEKWASLILAFGQMMIAFEGAPFIFSVQAKTREVEKFGGILTFAMSIVAVVYVLMGVLGYLAYGDETLASILSNMPDEPFYNALRGLLIAYIYLTIPFSLYATFEFLELDWHGWLTKHCCTINRTPANFLLRSMTGLICCGVVALVPDLGLLIALSGALPGALLNFAIPAFVDLTVRCDHQTVVSWLLNWIILLASTAAGCCCTGWAIYGIVTTIYK